MKPGDMQSDPFKRAVKYKQHKVGTWKLHEILGLPQHALRDMLMTVTKTPGQSVIAGIKDAIAYAKGAA